MLKQSMLGYLIFSDSATQWDQLVLQAQVQSCAEVPENHGGVLCDDGQRAPTRGSGGSELNQDGGTWNGKWMGLCVVAF